MAVSSLGVCTEEFQNVLDVIKLQVNSQQRYLQKLDSLSNHLSERLQFPLQGR